MAAWAWRLAELRLVQLVELRLLLVELPLLLVVLQLEAARQLAERQLSAAD